MGRALLNDIGVTPAGPHGIIYHKEDVIRLLKRLTDFGFFEDDGVETLPSGATPASCGSATGPSPRDRGLRDRVPPAAAQAARAARPCSW